MSDTENTKADDVEKLIAFVKSGVAAHKAKGTGSTVFIFMASAASLMEQLKQMTIPDSALIPLNQEERQSLFVFAAVGVMALLQDKLK